MLKNMPREGFIKFGKDPSPPLTSTQRTTLIRKGNELFNSGRIEEAKRIFLTAQYGDGLGRVGDYYFERQQPLEALKMYRLAPAPDKAEKLVERMSLVVRSWLQGDKT